MRRTKIIATIGPASDSPEVLEKMIGAGMDVARISLAHDSVERVLERYRLIRMVAEQSGRSVGILLDLPGPKIRAAPFPGGGVNFATDSLVAVKTGTSGSDADTIEIGYESLVEDIQLGDTLSLGDGAIQLIVEDVRADAVQARVTHGGRVIGRPGVHIPSERLSSSSPTDEDLEMLQPFLEEGIEMVAISFVRSGDDVRRLGTKPPPDGPLIVSKIETRGAVENLDSIMEASGAIMVARGDLGVEFPIQKVPVLQKSIIRQCIAKGLPVITATQMLESMVMSPNPTRAEASDVANAVFDGTSAVMLSGETAIGADPPLVLDTMSRIAEAADDGFDHKSWGQLLEEVHLPASKEDRSITDAITMAAWRVASEKSLAALLCISGSGRTVRSMARFRPQCPILGFSTDPRVIQQLTLSWGVKVIQSTSKDSYEERVREAIHLAQEQGYIRQGDVVGVLAGLSRHSRATDVFRLVTVR